MRKLIALTIILTIGFSSCKYEDGPTVSLRSKKNRVGHRIGKYWKSDKYFLRMGQEGYALDLIGVEGFNDIGDWEFNSDDSKIIFKSEMHQDFELVIKQLQHKKMKLEGAFPFDIEPKVHEYELDKTIDDLDQ